MPAYIEVWRGKHQALQGKRRSWFADLIVSSTNPALNVRWRVNGGPPEVSKERAVAQARRLTARHPIVGHFAAEAEVREATRGG